MATEAQFLDHANQNNAEYSNRRIVIKGTGAPTGATIAPYSAVYVDTVTDKEYRNVGTLATPSWSAQPDLSSKEDVGAAQSELRNSVPTAGDTLYKLYTLILSLGSGLSVPLPFDADAESLFPAGVSGDAYIVTVAGTVDTVSLGVGDLFWTDQTTAQQAGNYVDWFILEAVSDLATEAIAGLVELATQAEAEATSSQSNTVVLTALRGWQQIIAWWTDLKTTEGKDLSANDFTDTLLAKLNDIEANATADQTGGEIKTALFGESDTNNLTDTLLSKLNSLTQASEEVTRFDWTITGHSFTVGQPIAFNDNTNVFVVSKANDDDLQHLGFVTAKTTNEVTISLNGLIDITGWGLAMTTRYYLHTDGSLITTDNNFPVLQTISDTKAVIIARGSGAGSSSPSAISQKYTKEVDFSGSTNQVTLDHEADTILGVFIDGHLQDDDQWSSAVPVDVTVITLEDTSGYLNGRAVKVVYLQNAILGDDVTVYWADILNKPFPSQGGYDNTYYVAPVGDGTFTYVALPSYANPDLQEITGNGATTTLAITAAGLTLSNYSSRSLAYIDSSGELKQVTLGTGFSLSAGGQLDGTFLPLSGGTVTGDVTMEGGVTLTGLLNLENSSQKALVVNTTSGVVSYRNLDLDKILKWGNSSSETLEVAVLKATNLGLGISNLVYADSVGRLLYLALGTNLSLDGNVLNAAGGSGGGTTISGTTNKLAKFNNAGDNVIDSAIEDDGTSIGIFTAPISGSAIYISKNHNTSVMTIKNTATSGSVLKLQVVSGYLIEGWNNIGLKFSVDTNGSIVCHGLTTGLRPSIPAPAFINSSGVLETRPIDYNASYWVNKPTIPAAQVNSDWDASGSVAEILNKPSLHAVATSGNYGDLSNKPTLPLTTKVVDIGDWNMDSQATINVNHGLTLSAIRSVFVMIRNDDGTAIFPLSGKSLLDPQDGINSIVGTTVNLSRETNSLFDNTSFDSTSYNRGWVIIQYID